MYEFKYVHDVRCTHADNHSHFNINQTHSHMHTFQVNISKQSHNINAQYRSKPTYTFKCSHTLANNYSYSSKENALNHKYVHKHKFTKCCCRNRLLEHTCKHTRVESGGGGGESVLRCVTALQHPVEHQKCPYHAACSICFVVLQEGADKNNTQRQRHDMCRFLSSRLIIGRLAALQCLYTPEQTK